MEDNATATQLQTQVQPQIYATPQVPIDPNAELFRQFQQWMGGENFSASSAPFTVDPRSTALALLFSNPDFIADEVMPRIPVGGEKFEWSQGRGEEFIRENTRVGRTGQANRSEFGEDTIEAKTEDFAWEVPIPRKDEDLASVQGIRSRKDRAIKQCTAKLELDRELYVRDQVEDTDNYARTTTVTTAKWDGTTATGNPLTILNGIIAEMFMPPTHMVMPWNKWLGLSMNPFLVQAYNGNDGGVGMIPQDWFENLFKVKLVLGQAWINPSEIDLPPGVNFAGLQRIWGNNISLLRLDRTITSEESSMFWGFTAQWQGRYSGEYFDPRMGVRGGTVVKVGEHRKEIVSSKWAGHLIVNPFN